MNIVIAENQKSLDQAYRIRMNVFVDEQNVPAEVELDEHDETAMHFIGYQDSEAMAASRLRFMNDCGKLERICVLKPFRGQSYGKQLIKTMEETIKQHNYKKATLNAQTHAIAFYESLGYRKISGEFMDAGIPHVTMIKEF